MLSRPRLVGILLLVSWALNVALIVALFYLYRSPRIPPFPFASGGIPLEGPPIPGMPFPPEAREEFRQGARPLVGEQRELARSLYECLTADTLDTVRVRCLSDSLGRIRCRMQDMMIARMAGLHDQLTPDQREMIYSRMAGKLSMADHDRGRRRHRGE